jgi:hypothetical protein
LITSYCFIHENPPAPAIDRSTLFNHLLHQELNLLYQCLSNSWYSWLLFNIMHVFAVRITSLATPLLPRNVTSQSPSGAAPPALSLFLSLYLYHW